MKHCLWICLLSCLWFQARAQLSDSLYKALPNSLRPKNKLAVTAKERISLLVDASQILQLHYYADFNAITRQLARDVDTVRDKTEKIPYANAIASFYMSTGEWENYFSWAKKLMRFGEGSQKYRYYICWAYANSSLYYSRQGKQDSAVALLHKGLTVASQDTLTEDLRPIMYYGYIQIYRQLQLYQTSLEYANKYLKITPAKDRWNESCTEVVLAKTNAYIALFRTEKKAVYADSARRLIRETMLAKKAEASYWYFLCYFYEGLLAYHSQQYQLAIDYFNRSLSPVYRETQGDRLYLPKLYKNASLVGLGRWEGAQSLLDLAIPAKDFNGRKEVNRVLYHYYSQRGDYRRALSHYTQYQAYSDSVDIIGQKGKIFEAEQKYSVAQKEATIAQLENKNLQARADRNQLLIITIVVIFLLFIAAIGFYLRNKRLQLQRLAERQKLSNELHIMEQEMELDRLKQQADKEDAIVSQRQIISKNMHDEVSSSLAALRYLIADVKQQAQSTETKQALADIEDEAKTVYLQAREFMHGLHNSQLGQAYNVIDLLDNLALRFGVNSGLQVVIEANQSQIQRHFTAQQHAELYRIIKEAVANGMKHSGASRIVIRISLKEDNFYFDIQDDGRGMDQQEGSGLGLATMQQRITALRGDLRINSTASGLKISGYFPVVIDAKRAS